MIITLKWIKIKIKNDSIKKYINFTKIQYTKEKTNRQVS